MADIWQPTNKEEEFRTESVSPVITTVYNRYFPYLDVEQFWNQQGDLQFKVYNKPNQLIKYVNDGSCHTRSCLKAIPWGVLSRLAKLTLVTEANKTVSLGEL